MAKELEYEVYASGDKHLGNVWLEDSKVKSDNQAVMNVLEHKTADGFVSIHEGEKFLKKLPQILKNGYLHVKKVK